ncbi:barstar family protein [Thauera butanivorans]|jgi:hypothetical protein|uniref:barstar family protein n=1 Tax=Thauera butanivorans TaxID=86174 RepID=UPI000838BFD7|nr:barstar family protein [Thauera butanivorans]
MTPSRPCPPVPSATDPLILRVDLAGCTGKAELLDRFAAALHFPAWFGHNWDALADLLCDLSWLPASARHLVLSGPSGLRTADPDSHATLLEILDDSIAYWSGTSTPLSVAIEESGRSDDPDA